MSVCSHVLVHCPPIRQRPYPSHPSSLHMRWCDNHDDNADTDDLTLMQHHRHHRALTHPSSSSTGTSRQRDNDNDATTTTMLLVVVVMLSPIHPFLPPHDIPSFSLHPSMRSRPHQPSARNNTTMAPCPPPALTLTLTHFLTTYIHSYICMNIRVYASPSMPPLRFTWFMCFTFFVFFKHLTTSSVGYKVRPTACVCTYAVSDPSLHIVLCYYQFCLMSPSPYALANDLCNMNTCFLLTSCEHSSGCSHN